MLRANRAIVVASVACLLAFATARRGLAQDADAEEAEAEPVRAQTPVLPAPPAARVRYSIRCGVGLWAQTVGGDGSHCQFDRDPWTEDRARRAEISASGTAQQRIVRDTVAGENDRETEEDDDSSSKDDDSNYDGPALPEGETLDETLDRAAEPPPDDYPEPVPDDQVYAFLLGEQLEYRFGGPRKPDHLGLELQGWFGGDYNKLWWKNESEGAFQIPRGLEAETDLLYSRLITPFWNAQIGVQYANEWMADSYEDRWSGVLAVQGLAPGKFEVDASMYVSQHANVTFELETEYELRFTQRLVLQPLAELGVSTQDIPERTIGAGVTDVVVDLRLRYEIKREFAPYLGGRWHALVGETADRTEAAGGERSRLFLLGGFRFAIL